MENLTSSINFATCTISESTQSFVYSFEKKSTEHIAAYDQLCLICTELNIDLTNITDSDFESASIALNDFCEAQREDCTVSVWFD